MKAKLCLMQTYSENFKHMSECLVSLGRSSRDTAWPNAQFTED